MQHCFICQNKTDQMDAYHLLCRGCLSLLQRPQYACQQCGIDLKTPQDVCGQCQSAPPAFSKTYYACAYQSPIDQWVMSFKFGHNLKFSRLFAEMMEVHIAQIPSHYILMPVPLHHLRLRSRGYNQAYEIAIELSKLNQRPIDTSLKRHKRTDMQAQLTLAQRKKNVRNAFQLKQALKHLHIILIDDVMTTGNTLNECARALRKAGAKDVRVATFARKSLS